MSTNNGIDPEDLEDSQDEPSEPEVTIDRDTASVELPQKTRRERRAERPALLSRLEQAERDAREAKEELARLRQESLARQQPRETISDEMAEVYEEQRRLAQEAQSRGSMTEREEKEYWRKYQEIEAKKFQIQAKRAGYVAAEELEERASQQAVEQTLRVSFPDVMANPQAFAVAKNYYQIERAKRPNADGAEILTIAMDKARADFGLGRPPAPTRDEKSLFTGGGKSSGGGIESSRVVLDAATRRMVDESHKHIKDPKKRYQTWVEQMRRQAKKAG